MYFNFLKCYLLLALCKLLVFVGCSTNIPVTGRSALKVVPESRIQAISSKQFDDFLKENPESDNIEAKAQVLRVGKKIQSAIEDYFFMLGESYRLKDYKWEYRLIEGDSLNAFAMPGGKVAVYSGLLTIAQTDQALAVVIGHEMAHIVAGHGNERFSQALIAQGIALASGSIWEGDHQNSVKLALGLSSQLILLKYSRHHEAEADQLGLIFMAMAGYDPEEAIVFWEKMIQASDNKRAMPEFLSTHPNPKNRIQRLAEIIPEAKHYQR